MNYVYFYHKLPFRATQVAREGGICSLEDEICPPKDDMTGIWRSNVQIFHFSAGRAVIKLDALAVLRAMLPAAAPDPRQVSGR
ncbi:MAG: hypothetical protein JWN15_719 [Firmicutes bacterium]|nr:hypothetical protein [Bacillota bacterium]